MIDNLLSMVFRCPHRHLTRPITPVNRAGVPHGDTYVVCLDCAKQFPYDLKNMRIGKALDRAHESSVLRPEPRNKRKLKYALWASLPLALLVGSALKSRKPAAPAPAVPERKPAEPPAATPPR